MRKRRRRRKKERGKGGVRMRDQGDVGCLEGEGEAGRERRERWLIVIRVLEKDYFIKVSLARLLSLG